MEMLIGLTAGRFISASMLATYSFSGWVNIPSGDVPAYDRQFNFTAERFSESLQRGDTQAGAPGFGLGNGGLGAAEPFGQLALGDACLLAGLAQQHACPHTRTGGNTGARHKP